MIRRIALYMMACLLAVSCSTKKNTRGTRFYHAQAARFNAMHNGKEAYKTGQEAQRTGHQDDYTQLLPMYVVTNATTAKLGTSSYETTITKCEKAIKLHSIKKRPTISSGKKLTPKQKEYRQRKEFNPYLRHAWLLMGKAQFMKGDFIEAASTFGYVMRMYATQPEVYGVAKAWLARCYVANGWPYDAEDVIAKMRHDTLTSTARRERTATQAALLVHTGQYAEALPLLQSTARATRNKRDKARLHFLTAQLYREVGDTREAYRYYNKVVKCNPPYELEFNARIAQTEVAAKGQAKKMIGKLRRMAKSDKNKDYLDQLHYAIGNIHLSEGDTLRCTWAWETGVEKSTKNGIAKAVLLLRLSELYWQTEQYIEAARTYKACIAILSKERTDYAEAERRSKVLDEAEPHLSAIHLQDSLQALAKMPEKERNEAIDRVIEALKKKEKEEAKKAAANESAQGTTNTGATPTATTATTTATQAKGAWYFYNPTTLAAGKQEFTRKWGKRANVDYWRLTDKPATEDDTYSSDSLPEDTLSTEEQRQAEEQARNDSLAADPHRREYYLAQIPFTEEQLATSNALLADGLYNGGIIAAEKIQNFPYAMRLLLRLLRDFPDYGDEAKANIYYHLFLIYGRLSNDSEAETWRETLIEAYPESKLAQLVSNPQYEMIARDGKHVEDTTYAQAYMAYKENSYGEVARLYDFHTHNFPEGTHRARIMFIQAMSLLYSGHRTEFLALLQDLIQKYGSDAIAELATHIVKGVQEGRLLSGSKYDASDIWSYRSNAANALGTDSLATDTLSTERLSPFNFVLAYARHSLDEDQLLYEVARYNFSHFMVRNFELEILDDDRISMLCVKGFVSYDEVHAYAQQLYSDPYMARTLQGIRTLLISEANLALIGKAYSFDEYAEFYSDTFDPLSSLPVLLDEPTDIEYQDPDNIIPTDKQDDEPDTYDDFPFGF